MPPDKVPSPLPPQCALDRDRIERMDDNLSAFIGEFREFISTEGPFIAVRDRVSVLETKTDGLVAKVTGIVVSVMGIAWLVISKFLTGDGNG